MTFATCRIIKRRKAIPAFALLIVAMVLPASRVATAHPMGNFSISHFAGLHVKGDAVELRYILDFAEIPTFQEIQATGIVASPDDPRVVAYLASKAEALKHGLAVTLNGHPLSLTTAATNVIFPPGAGNLPTMKIGVVYRGSFPGVACPCTLEYRDGNFPERAGWKEVVADTGPSATLTMSTAPGVSRSHELANYPTDLINSPPQDLSARLTFALTDGVAGNGTASARPGIGSVATEDHNRSEDAGPGLHRRRPSSAQKALGTNSQGPGTAAPPAAGSRAAAKSAASPGVASAASGRSTTPAAASTESLLLQANRQSTPRNAFTELITSNRWGIWFLLTAALIAAALGGLHALEPGHGKTIVAAYLVGSQGTAAHALLLGLIVTATHTAGVYALGLVTLYASKYIVPERLYPWLGIASGLTIAVLGLYMLRRRLQGHSHAHGHHHHHHGPSGHSHDHHHDHTGALHHHEHEPTHTHSHLHDDSVEAAAAHGGNSPFSYRQLVMLGVTGGIVPCPAALVVLLGAISLHRVAFGLYLIVAFSLGLASVLISIGMITVYARRLLSRLPSDGPLIHRWLPTASAAAIMCLGIGIAVQALVTMGAIHVRL